MSESIGNTGSGMKLHTRILLGLLIGAVVGIAANQALGGDHALVAWVNKYLAGPVGQIFLRMLFMIVIPLVFASITLGVAGLGDLKKAGRVGGKAVTYFFLSTALAATLGLVIVAAARPGDRLDPTIREELLQQYAGDATSRVQAAATSTFGIGTLVKRGRERLEMEITQFSVLVHDGVIVGCAALYPFSRDKAAELACLAVMPEYRRLGYGDQLMRHIEARARKARLRRLFVLTTRTAHWFVERGFDEKGLDDLPDAKRELYNLQRRSKVLVKSL